MPRIGRGRDGVRPVLPDEPAFAELGRIDPAGHGHGCYDIEPNVAVRLSDRLVRVTANNGSMMTGPGTNTYLLRGADGAWAAIDPGPDEPAHVEAILAAAPGPITRIYATHTHRDHSPACRELKARTGASVAGQVAAYPEWQDATFTPDVVLRGGERIALAPDCTLRVIHTPGHASNHLCYLLEEEKTLFTGDHVMQLSTVVISPPDGDMAAYMQSLERVAARGFATLWPTHGPPVTEVAPFLAAYREHRLERERQILAQLAAGRGLIAEMVPILYAAVPAGLHPAAAHSVWAHLIKLAAEGRAASEGPPELGSRYRPA
jgi:glyoxylase-like metal-dependent hydrolase (beta-lactamase superfamily II)